MRTVFVLALACALLGVAALAPTAAAHVTFGVDFNGDGRCDDPGETFVVPAPDPVHRHGPCSV